MKEENRWEYNQEIKEKYLPKILLFISNLEKDIYEDLDLTNSGLAPYHVWKILEELGYENTNMVENGWEQDFWIEMAKENVKTITIRCCGMTHEIELTCEE